MNGMNFTSHELVEVIKACKASRVNYLKLGELVVKFDTGNHPDKTKRSAYHMDVVTTGGEGHPPGPILPDEKLDGDVMTMAELADQLAIEDPVAYEELQMKAFNQGVNN
jgi:hypothetical protein